MVSPSDTNQWGKALYHCCETNTSPLTSFSKDYPVGNLGSLNYVQIYLHCTQSGTSLNFNNVVLAGNNLGNFSCPTGSNKNWNVTGVDLSNGFSLTGDLLVNSTNACQECIKLEIWVGYSVPPDDEGPVTSSVVVDPSPACLNGSATVNATVDDTDTGGSNIASAQYSLNGTWFPMLPSDGSFDSVSEGVTAGFDTTKIGANEVCVKGTDALNNSGAQTCQSFVVNYDFTGFFQPINNEAVNKAKAGQAIPAKWRIMDCAGSPIDDSGSFVALAHTRLVVPISPGIPPMQSKNMPRVNQVLSTTGMATGSSTGRRRRPMPEHAGLCTLSSRGAQRHRPPSSSSSKRLTPGRAGNGPACFLRRAGFAAPTETFCSFPSSCLGMWLGSSSFPEHSKLELAAPGSQPEGWEPESKSGWLHQRNALNCSTERPASFTMPPIVNALIGLWRGIVTRHSSLLMTMCLPCLII